MVLFLLYFKTTWGVGPLGVSVIRLTFGGPCVSVAVPQGECAPVSRPVKSLSFVLPPKVPDPLTPPLNHKLPTSKPVPTTFARRLSPLPTVGTLTRMTVT